MRVYADNAATTYISETAMNTLVDCLKNYNSNPNSLHTEGQITAEKLAESREKVAKAINAANPNEIYFTSGGSEADNQALLSAARVLKDKGKKCSSLRGSVLMFGPLLGRFGKATIAKPGGEV